MPWQRRGDPIMPAAEIVQFPWQAVTVMAGAGIRPGNAGPFAETAVPGKNITDAGRASGVAGSRRRREW